MPNVSNLVKTIQDIMRKDAGTYGDAQRLEQLGWMFFLKIFDDREKELDLLRDDYVSPLAPELRSCNWAADEEGLPGDALLDFVNNTLLPRLENLVTGGDQVAVLIRSAFDDANNTGKLLIEMFNRGWKLEDFFAAREAYEAERAARQAERAKHHNGYRRW